MDKKQRCQPLLGVDLLRLLFRRRRRGQSTGEEGSGHRETAAEQHPPSAQYGESPSRQQTPTATAF